MYKALYVGDHRTSYRLHALRGDGPLAAGCCATPGGGALGGGSSGEEAFLRCSRSVEKVNA